METKTDITVKELEPYLKEHEIDKLMMPEENIFNNVIT
jgi:hypothetical protein